MTGQRLDIRELDAEDDLEAELDLRHRAFGPMPAGQRALRIDELRAKASAGRLYGALDGSRLVGTAGFHDMRQWWHGRSLPPPGLTAAAHALD